MNRGFSCIGLDNPKFEENVGGALRAATCYDVSLILIKGRRFKLNKLQLDTPKTSKHKPVIFCEDLKKSIPYNTVPIAVDLIEGAIPLYNFTHPERALYIFGAEDATLGKRITDWCKYTVFVPTTVCMNLAATVNVVLYDRLLKESKK